MGSFGISMAPTAVLKIIVDSKEAEAGLGGFSNKTLAAMAGIAAAAAAASIAIGKMMLGWIREGDRSAQVFENLKISITEASRAAGGTVSQFDLAAAANRAWAADLRLNADQLADVSRLADDFADRTGGDTTEAVNTLIDALIKGTDRGLRPFGLAVEKNKDLLATLSTKVDALGDVTVTTAEKIEAMTIAMDDAWLAFQEGFATSEEFARVSTEIQSGLANMGTSWSALARQIGEATAKVVFFASSFLPLLPYINVILRSQGFVGTGTGHQGQQGGYFYSSAGPMNAPAERYPATRPERGGGGGQRDNENVEESFQEFRRRRAATEKEEEIERQNQLQDIQHNADVLRMRNIKAVSDFEKSELLRRASLEANLINDMARKRKEEGLQQIALIKDVTSALIQQGIAQIAQGLAAGQSAKQISKSIAETAAWQALFEAAAAIAALAVTWGVPNPAFTGHTIAAGMYGALALTAGGFSAAMPSDKGRGGTGYTTGTEYGTTVGRSYNSGTGAGSVTYITINTAVVDDNTARQVAKYVNFANKRGYIQN